MSNREHGAREREPPAPSQGLRAPVNESKLKSTAANLALTASLLSTSRSSADLSQFSNKNIKRQRRNDIISEKQEARVDSKIFTVEDKLEKLTDERQSLSKERYALVKSEYGSIENYAKAKKRPDFRKSANHSALTVKVAEADSKIEQTNTKLQQHSARKENILDERSQSKYFRASRGRHLESSIDSKCKLERKAARREVRLDSASKGLPAHYIVRKTYRFNPETGKIQKKLMLEKSIKPIDGRGGIVTKGLKGLGAVSAVRLSASIHGQLTKNNSGTDSEKAFNTGLRAIEHGTVKAVRNSHKFLAERPYKRVSKLQLKSDKANAKLYATRKGGTTRQMKQNAKKHMERAKQARKAKSRSERFAETVKNIGRVIGKIMFNPILLLILGIGGLIILFLTMLTGGFTAVGGNSGAFLGAVYAEEEEVYAAEDCANEYAVTAVQEVIDGVIADNPADEVVINPYTLGHNPYALLSFLSAFNTVESGEEYDNTFIASDTDIQQAIERFIDTLYYIEYSLYSYEITTVVLDEDGNPELDEDGNEVTETITHTVLYITVIKRSEEETAQLIFNSGSPYNSDMLDYYLLYIETFGFRPELFPEYSD